MKSIFWNRKLNIELRRYQLTRLMVEAVCPLVVKQVNLNGYTPEAAAKVLAEAYETVIRMDRKYNDIFLR